MEASTALHRARWFKIRTYAWDALAVLLAICFLGSVIFFAIVRPIMLWEKGIYAGTHYNDGKNQVVGALAVKYGLHFTQSMRLANPPVVNAHSNRLLITGQVRIFHLYGPRGVKYCVWDWYTGDGHWSKLGEHGVFTWGNQLIYKGCDFNSPLGKGDT